MKKLSFIAALMAVAMIFSACARDLGKGRLPNKESTAAGEESSVPPALDSSKQELLRESSESSVIEELPLPPLDLTVDKENLEKHSSDPVTWGFGPHFDDRGRSVSCVALQEKYKDFNVLFIGEDSPTISLTFDEGYENGFTPRILDILKEKEVKATFFITGDYYRRAPELIRRMIDEGHTVGSHSDKHIDFTKASTEDCIADLTLLHENIRKDFDYEMRCFRFPTGAFSQRSLELIKDLGYKSVFWSFGYKDWDPKVQMKPEEALEKLKSSLHPGEVLLLHPVGETNCTILGDFIDSVKEKGYEFTTVL